MEAVQSDRKQLALRTAYRKRPDDGADPGELMPPKGDPSHTLEALRADPSPDIPMVPATPVEGGAPTSPLTRKQMEGMRAVDLRQHAESIGATIQRRNKHGFIDAIEQRQAELAETPETPLRPTRRRIQSPSRSRPMPQPPPNPSSNGQPRQRPKLKPWPRPLTRGAHITVRPRPGGRWLDEPPQTPSTSPPSRPSR